MEYTEEIERETQKAETNNEIDRETQTRRDRRYYQKLLRKFPYQNMFMNIGLIRGEAIFNSPL